MGGVSSLEQSPGHYPQEFMSAALQEAIEAKQEPEVCRDGSLVPKSG